MVKPLQKMIQSYKKKYNKHVHPIVITLTLVLYIKNIINLFIRLLYNPNNPKQCLFYRGIKKYNKHVHPIVITLTLNNVCFTIYKKI